MYIVIFFILSFLAIRAGNIRPNVYCTIGLTLLFIIFVGFRGENVDCDYKNYLSDITGKELFIVEDSYRFIVWLSMAVFNSSTLIFIIYAILGVSLKIYAIREYSSFFFLSLLLYFSTIFILQEMNAIRAGVASGFMLLSLRPWAQGKNLLALALLCVAVFFHYSFMILLPIFFFVKNTPSKITWFLWLLPLAYLMCFMVHLPTVISYVGIPYISDKLAAYQHSTTTLNIFSTVFLVKIAFVIILYYHREFLAAKSPYFYLFLKLYILGIFIVIFFAQLPIVGTRLMDIFLIVEIFLLPMCCWLVEPRYIPIGILILFALFYLYLYVYIGEYLKPYYFIFEHV